MTFEKAKKRGRPAQLLQVAELHGFVEFLRRQERSELQDEVMMFLLKKDFNFELLSEPQQVLVKEALKPYREHTRLVLLADQLESEKNKSEYEKKFLKLYDDYECGLLEKTDVNLLKTMCTRYLNFKAQKLDVSDLELYLSQIQKNEAKKKRTAENRRKFEVGGAVLAACKELQIGSNSSSESIKDMFIEYHRYFHRMRATRFFAEASRLTSSYRLEDDVIVIALNNLSKYTHDGKSITTIEIEKAILEVNELRNKKY
ncbi:hypothetical protein ABLT98_17200 [Acinetobacter baumannii]|uniref:hypothetical protein n=1 Tax=Acinetobacter baumannii TaxID=470 RepID=UPI0032B4A524